MINIYGKLASDFEKKYKYKPKNIKINVFSAQEMVNALEANFKGFKSLFRADGLYKVVRGLDIKSGESIEENELAMRFKEPDWNIMPIVAGSGPDDGFGRVILGAALIGASFFVPGGMGIALLGKDILFTSMLTGIGIPMVLGGVAQMLTPSPSVSNYGDREKPDERPSYLSNGPVNSVEPGLPIPVGYGAFWGGSITVSGGMKIEEI
ncbi:unnamed protein product [marine sediment metagenome]|uniref:Tail assembly protein n=1 Tax=marine sediment metagenome TaxID=412755 RepID=X1BCV4_9ZZZZ